MFVETYVRLFFLTEEHSCPVRFYLKKFTQKKKPLHNPKLTKPKPKPKCKTPNKNQK